MRDVSYCSEPQAWRRTFAKARSCGSKVPRRSDVSAAFLKAFDMISYPFECWFSNGACRTLLPPIASLAAVSVSRSNVARLEFDSLPLRLPLSTVNARGRSGFRARFRILTRGPPTYGLGAMVNTIPILRDLQNMRQTSDRAPSGVRALRGSAPSHRTRQDQHRSVSRRFSGGYPKSALRHDRD